MTHLASLRRALLGLRPPARTAQRPRDRRRSRRGGSAVEFAVTLPVMVLLLLGTIEYGNFFSDQARVVAAARDAARFGANQQSLGLARTRAELAGRIVLTDMGFPCGGLSAACSVDAAIVQQNGLNFIEVTMDVEYANLTGAVPRGGLDVIPTRHVARATYPVTGVR